MLQPNFGDFRQYIFVRKSVSRVRVGHNMVICKMSCLDGRPAVLEPRACDIAQLTEYGGHGAYAKNTPEPDVE